MNATTKKIATLLTAGLLAGGIAQAATILDVNLGSNHDGFGGFATSTSNSNQTWTEQTDSIRFISQNSGMSNASLMRELGGVYALAGASYTFSSVIDTTGQGANNNNRIALSLFANTSTAADLNDTGVVLHFYRGNSIQINRGLNNFSEGSSSAWSGAPLGSGVFTFEATVAFTHTAADISFTLTDWNAHSQTLTHTIPLTRLDLGGFHGVSTRARTDQGGTPPPDLSFNVRSFTCILNSEPDYLLSDFDFGTDPGKITAVDAGFGLSLTGGGSFDDQTDGLEVNVNIGSGFQNFAFLRSFDQLGGGNSKDFTLSTTVRVNDLAGGGHENNDRWGLLLFGVPGNDTANSNGISAQVLTSADTTTGESKDASIVLRDGINGTFLRSVTWKGGPIVQGDELRFTVEGLFRKETELSLVFTLSRLDGSNAHTIATTVSGEVLNGTLFGSALRIKNGRSIEFDEYSVTVDTSVGLPKVPDQLVAEGVDGLIYSPYANERQANVANTVPDFSRAGYAGGGVAIPHVPAAVTLTPSGGNDTVAIQNAINDVAALPIGPDGFRGAVVLTAGDYTVSSTLQITADGIVIRGHGQQEVGGTRITHAATTQSDLFEFNGSGGPMTTGSVFPIDDAYIPVGSRTLTLSDASSFSPGDLILITNTMNQKWIDDLDTGWVGWTPGQYQLQHYRYIESIDGNVLTLDAPIVQTIEDQYGSGTVQKCTWSGALDNVGLEGIRAESTFTSDTDEQHGWYVLKMNRVRNGWVRQVTSRYFGQGLVSIEGGSQFVTVEDCAHLDPKSTTAGGRRYSFNINDSNYILMQRCLTRQGRHDFVTGSRTHGPNAFVDSLATQPINDIGPHHRYATGQIYDNIKAEENPNSSNDAIRVQNRTNSGSGHGWSGAQILFWNSDAPEIVCDAPAGAMNWSVGTVGVQAESTRSPWEPFGIWESHNSTVQVLPRSLYLAQLRDRLGADAVRRVSLPLQATDTLWTELKTWDGNGLLLDPLVVWADADADFLVNQSIPLHSNVRDLRLLDNLVSVLWEQISGPGLVSFSDSSALETSATFSEIGTYGLQLTLSGGGIIRSATTTITIEGGSGVNNPPSFTSDPIVKANATEGSAYTGTIAGDASDPEGDPMTFSKVSGPAWLSVAADGTLSGTPGSADVGLNSWIVQVDATGGSDQATLEITVDEEAAPPAAPTGLVAEAGIGDVYLDWADNTEVDLAGYNVYRSTNSESGYIAIATGLITSDYLDSAVDNHTVYYYRVTAVNTNGNESALSDYTSAKPGWVANLAVSDVAVLGTVQGSLADIDQSNNVYQSITEVISGNTSALEHKWVFDVIPAELVTVYLEAHHSANSEGDNFVFSYSTDDVNYTDMITVTKTSDDDAVQWFAIPGSPGGTLYIRVRDADRTDGNTQLDTIHIDNLFIVSEESSAAPSTATSPTPANGAADVTVNADLSWDGGLMASSHDVYFGTNPSPAFQGNQIDTTFDPGTLLNSTTYYWAIDAVNNSGTTSGSVWSFTTEATAVNSMNVDSITLTAFQAGGPNRKGRATVVVVDHNGQPVQNASVTGTFSGDINETIVGTTNSGGQTVIESHGKAKAPVSLTFTVDNVTHESYTYDSSANVVTSVSGTFN